MTEEIKIIEFGNTDKSLLKKFVRFHWDLYRDDKRYVPQLNAELLGSKILGIKGLLTAEHPFHKKAEVRYYLALKDNKVVGRIAAIDNRVYNKTQEYHTVFFGFFECIDDIEVSNILLQKGIDWGLERGAKRFMGPVNFDTTDNMGLLIDGFDTHHYLMTVWNFPYYQALIEGFRYKDKGFVKAMGLIGQEMPVQTPDEIKEKRDRLGSMFEKIKERRGIELIRVTTSNLDKYVPLMQQVYNSAWEKNYGFAPITDEDAEMLKQNLKIIVNQSVILLAFVKGELAAFFGALADINDMIERRNNILDLELFRFIRILYNRTRTKYIRLFASGVVEGYRKIGVDAVIYHEGFNVGQTMKNLKICEMSWQLETNTLVLSAADAVGGHVSKHWRLYEMLV